MSTTVGFPATSGCEDWEKQAIIGFHLKNPLEGYRRLTVMMLDADVVGGEPLERVAGAGPGGTSAQVQRKTV
jgi:hypothetical protein